MRIDPLQCKIGVHSFLDHGKPRGFNFIEDHDRKGNVVHLIRYNDLCDYLGINTGIIHGVINVRSYTVKLRQSNLGSLKFLPLFSKGGSTVMMVSANGLVKMITTMLKNNRKINRDHAERVKRDLIKLFPDEIVNTYKVQTKQTSLNFDHKKSKRQELHSIMKQQDALNRRVAELMDDDMERE